MRILILALITFACTGIINGQTTRLELTQLGIFSSEDNGSAKVYFNQPGQLKEIIISKTQVQKESNVWRVQIYQGSGKNSRQIAESTRNSFKTKFPEVDAEKIYHSPYFKVQVGNFKSRIEAESLKQKIQNDYPNCWIIKVATKQ